MIRIFIAIDLPEDIKGSLTSLRSKIKCANWVKREQMHLTLTFIGEVSEFKLREITEVLNQISFHPFSLKLYGVGHFAQKVFWAGINPNEDLGLLKDEIDQKLLGIGIQLENKSYKPHIALARLKGSKADDLAKLLEQFSLFESREIKVDKFILFSSTLTPKGAIHSVESEFIL
ncbi:MAG: RNA 2',3'-cyclic phosphodiesterase [Deltaproteobacteria bacterium]|nr:MAG: RNA 2',3'-cyclic phosphodiesterase [Deltaproteobacteria bacterium]